MRIPNPINLFLQNLSAPYLKISDTFCFVRLAVHLLAFSHEHDYRRYDGISFQQMMDDLGVSPRVQHLILTPFILSFDFDIPENISAACGLSGSQFYVIHDQKSILTRWSRGLPADKIFGPLVNFLTRNGGVLMLESPVEKITVENGEASGIVYRAKEVKQLESAGVVNNQPSSPDGQIQVLASIPTAQIPNDSFVKVKISERQQYYVSHQNGNFRALSAECTHQGCMVDWNNANRIFKCPCHGGEYDPQGEVQQGPPPRPLEKIKTRLAGENLELLGTVQSKQLRFRDVILAADTRASQAILQASNDIDPDLQNNVAQLDTTPVIVVRLWFNQNVVISQELESAITPDAEFIDNFFFLNAFSTIYNREGVILEVQSYRVDMWLDRADEEILEVALRDLATFCLDAQLENLLNFKIQRHRTLFTKYAPGKMRFRPNVESGTGGLYLAGDWTEADWSVWMMERAVVSGLRAANAVLKRRGRQQIEILRLPKEDFILRFSRWVSRLLRKIFWRNYPSRYESSR